MGKYIGIMKKPIVANTPGQDTRQNKPSANGKPSIAKVEAIPYKNAVMGRSKFINKHGTHKTIID